MRSTAVVPSSKELSWSVFVFEVILQCISWHIIEEDPIKLTSRDSRLVIVSYIPHLEFCLGQPINLWPICLVNFFGDLWPVYPLHHVINLLRPISHRDTDLPTPGQCFFVERPCFCNFSVSRYGVSCKVSFNCIVNCNVKVVVGLETTSNIIIPVISDGVVPARWE